MCEKLSEVMDHNSGGCKGYSKDEIEKQDSSREMEEWVIESQLAGPMSKREAFSYFPSYVHPNGSLGNAKPLPKT